MRTWKSFAIVIFLVFHVAGSRAQSQLDSIINSRTLSELVQVLASDSFKGRLTGSPGALLAANFIKDEFKSAGTIPLAPYKDYLISFQSPWRSSIGYNVVGVLPGNDNGAEAIIYSAHYDHLGTIATTPFRYLARGRNQTDSIFNGANDNASGVAALITLARYYGRLKNNKRTIIFMAFAGEELGLVGSSAMAMVVKKPSAIVCGINLEMLGRGRYPFVTGNDLGNLQFLLNKELSRVDKTRYGKNFFKRDPYPDQKLFSRSDNFPFAQLKIPAHTIIASSDEDEYYHTLGDEHSTLNYRFMEGTIRAIAISMKPIVDGQVKPSRIDASDYTAPIPIR